MIITRLTVFNFKDGKVPCIEQMAGATLEEVKAKTMVHFKEKLK